MNWKCDINLCLCMCRDKLYHCVISGIYNLSIVTYNFFFKVNIEISSNGLKMSYHFSRQVIPYCVTLCHFRGLPTCVHLLADKSCQKPLYFTSVLGLSYAVIVGWFVNIQYIWIILMVFQCFFPTFFMKDALLKCKILTRLNEHFFGVKTECNTTDARHKL